MAAVNTNKRFMGVALTMQCGAVAALLAVPLFFPEMMPFHKPEPPLVVRSRPKFVEVISTEITSGRALTSSILPAIRRAFTEPTRIPQGINLSPEDAPATIAYTQSSEIGIPNSTGDAIASFFTRPQAAAPPPAPAPTKTIEPKIDRIAIGGNVQSAKLVHRVLPIYPPLARQARIQGTVKLDSVIARDGTVQQLRVISGHPLLVPAAVEAVRQWRYSPTLLNGEPVEVQAPVDVNFTLSN